ncbi:MAG: TIGR00180 family glycosyltransferase [Lachnospiraceae bacterium]|nr:TIGR00180 family glycosyltransferase [Lachnospiraceae bacterium]
MYKTTLLIPTRNRPERIERLVSFLAKESEDYDITIKVLDGSTSDDIARRNEQACLANKIGYKHYDPDLHFFKRVYEALQDVDTLTVSMLDDEDIISLKGLMDCVTFLNEHEDYSITAGQYKVFHYAESGISFSNCYQGQSFEQESQLERIRAVLNPYITPICYAVHKTSSLKLTFMELSNAAPKILDDDYATIELLWAAIVASCGKLKRLESFYIGRGSYEKPEIRREESSYKTQIMNNLDYAMGLMNYETSFVESHRRNRGILLKYLPEIDKEHASKIIDLIFAYYFFHQDIPRTLTHKYNQAFEPRVSFKKRICNRLRYEKSRIADFLFLQRRNIRRNGLELVDVLFILQKPRLNLSSKQK